MAAESDMVEWRRKGLRQLCIGSIGDRREGLARISSVRAKRSASVCLYRARSASPVSTAWL